MKPWELGLMQKGGKSKNKKKIQKNAFYFYMMEYNTTYLNGKCSDLRRLQEIAGKSWETMTIEDRKPYEVMANRSKNRCASDNRVTHYGLPYNEIPEENRRKEEMMKQAVDEIEQTVQCLDAASTLQTKDFYFIHCNSHVRTVTGIVVPCELAVCRYNIKAGVVKVYNTILNIRPIPLGYAADANQFSAASHKIPAPAEGLGETNARAVFREILQFLMPEEELQGELEEMVHLNFPPVYTVKGVAELTGECIAAVTACCIPPNSAKELPLPIVNVYPIEVLLNNILKNIVRSVQLGNDDVPEEQEVCKLAENDAFIYAKFYTDIYTQAPDIACEYHEKEDCREHCSKSWVIRMSYTISDFSCNLLGVHRQKWRHYATNSSVVDRKTTPRFLSGGSAFHQSTKQEVPPNDEVNFPRFESLPRLVPPVVQNVKHEMENQVAAPFRLPMKMEPLHVAVDRPRLHQEPEIPQNSFAGLPRMSIPPPTSSLYDDDDDDSCSIISATSISSLRSLNQSLNLESILRATNKNCTPLAQCQTVSSSQKPISDAQFGVDGTVARGCYERDQRSAFNMEPEFEYLRCRTNANIDESDTQSVAGSIADSFVSVPLSRYMKPAISLTDPSKLLAKPPRPSLSILDASQLNAKSFNPPQQSLPVFDAHQMNYMSLNTPNPPVQGLQQLPHEPVLQHDVEDDDEEEDVAANIFTQFERSRTANDGHIPQAEPNWPMAHSPHGSSPASMLNTMPLAPSPNQIQTTPMQTTPYPVMSPLEHHMQYGQGNYQTFEAESHQSHSVIGSSEDLPSTNPHDPSPKRQCLGPDGSPPLAPLDSKNPNLVPLENNPPVKLRQVKSEPDDVKTVQFYKVEDWKGVYGQEEKSSGNSTVVKKEEVEIAENFEIVDSVHISL